jgi:glycosyltransferase involved in cell wall biosynthesis
VKRAFLTLPSLEGHRQIYCRRFCDYLLSRDFSVTVATDLSGLGEYARLEALTRHAHVRVVSDTWSREKTPVARLRGLVAAARQADPDLTFIAEADESRGMLSAQLTHPWLRLPGRRVALFIRSTKYVHEDDRPLRLRLFHEVVAQRLPVFEKALALDEVFVAQNGGRYVWMPDIAVWSAEGEGDGGEDDGGEAAAWQARLADFLAGQQGRPVVVYIGMPQERRNYERLLELARDVDGCFVQCGALHDPTGYPREDPAARRELVARSAILEYGRFYQSFETARLTLAAARSVVLPYIPWHTTSSGVMLQALMAGRPVLVADRGLMGWRVRTAKVGLTYASDDWRDMREKFMALEAMPSGAFTDRIARFLEYFSKEQFEAAMDVAIGLGERGPRLPGGA